jgi:hypothetical protein
MLDFYAGDYQVNGDEADNDFDPHVHGYQLRVDQRAIDALMTAR